jgi:thioredoxin-dependent peroxiredoxin
MLKPGAKLPVFSLKDQNGNSFNNKSLSGQRVVFYFYPKDDTPGCTKEACNFRDNLPKFSKLQVPVYGISADDEKTHNKFITKYDLNFSLLSDTDHALCEAFGTWVEKSMYGKKYFGIQRSTFLISADGKIEKVWEKVSPEFHAREILDYLSGKSTGEDEKVVSAPKSVAKKTPAKKVAPTKKLAETSVKKIASTKAAAKKVPPKKAPAKKVAAKKTPSRKK